MISRTTNNIISKHYKNRNADERQSELYKKFPATSFLGTPQNVDHFIQWILSSVEIYIDLQQIILVLPYTGIKQLCYI